MVANWSGLKYSHLPTAAPYRCSGVCSQGDWWSVLCAALSSCCGPLAALLVLGTPSVNASSLTETEDTGVCHLHLLTNTLTQSLRASNQPDVQEKNQDLFLIYAAVTQRLKQNSNRTNRLRKKEPPFSAVSYMLLGLVLLSLASGWISSKGWEVHSEKRVSRGHSQRTICALLSVVSAAVEVKKGKSVCFVHTYPSKGFRNLNPLV